jgi:hypothetical protein
MFQPQAFNNCRSACQTGPEKRHGKIVIVNSPKNNFSTTLPILVLVHKPGTDPTEWLPFDKGPGYFRIPDDCEAQISIKNADDEDLKLLIQEVGSSDVITSLDLSENRKITDKGLMIIKGLSHLKELDLSSCDITNTGIEHLLDQAHLEKLSLRFCHRLTDPGVVKLRSLNLLTQLDLRNLPKITNGSLSKIKRKDLLIFH